MKKLLFIASVFLSASAIGQNSLKATGNNNAPLIFINPNTAGNCSYQQVGNNLENGYASYYLGTTIYYQEADAFDVPANETWQIQGVRSNFFRNGTPTGHWTRLLSDAGNTPGTEITFIKTNTLTSTIVGNNYGYDVHEITVMLPSPWTITGGISGTRYWLVNMDESSSMTYWENRSDYNYNNTNGYQWVGTSGPWNINSSVTSHVFEILYNTLDSVQTSICKGDSILLGGNYVGTAGIYTDTSLNINGCDSVTVVDLSIDSVIVSLSSFTNDTVCGDDSLVPLPAGSPSGGVYNGTGVSGNYFDPTIAGAGTFTIFYTFTDTVTGCFATDSTMIFVDTVMVALSPFSSDTVCDNGGLVPLPSASPAGGSYSGTGVVGTDFDPMVAGIGNHTIYYSFTDSVTMCSGMDSVQINVKSCVGIEDNSHATTLSVYPNPVHDMLRIYMSSGNSIAGIHLESITGEELLYLPIEGMNYASVDMSSFAMGCYLLKINTANGITITRQLIK